VRIIRQDGIVVDLSYQPDHPHVTGDFFGNTPLNSWQQSEVKG
jgi:hypothetical protein